MGRLATVTPKHKRTEAQPDAEQQHGKRAHVKRTRRRVHVYVNDHVALRVELLAGSAREALELFDDMVADDSNWRHDAEIVGGIVEVSRIVVGSPVEDDEDE